MNPGEKLENCPECGKDLKQREYDLQFCEACKSGMGFQHAKILTQADIDKIGARSTRPAIGRKTRW